MRKHVLEFHHRQYQVYSYNSISDYLADAEDTDKHDLGHNSFSPHWTGTKSWEEAVELARFGWTEVAKEMTAQLKVALKNTKTDEIIKNVLDVCGYQANVPMYLVGVPTNMIRQNRVRQKAKVVNVIKPMGATSNVSREQYVKAGVECMRIINALEKRGYAVNLFIASASEVGSKYATFLVKVKSSNERLNVSKLAFFLASPSVHRRFNFSLIQKHVSHGGSVGSTQDPWTAREMMKVIENAKIVGPSYTLDSSLGQGFTGKSAEDMVDSMVKHFEK